MSSKKMSSEKKGKKNTCTPIAVDLDGTLIREESHQVFLSYVWQTCPRELGHVVMCFLTQGRAAAKEALVRLCPLDHFSWTFHPDLLKVLRARAESGVPLLLVTGAPQPFADHIAAKLDLFSGVLGSTPPHNLVGRQKVKALQHFLQGRNFIYVGNSRKDLWVWRCAVEAWVVGPSRFLRVVAKLFLKSPLFYA